MTKKSKFIFTTTIILVLSFIIITLVGIYAERATQSLAAESTILQDSLIDAGIYTALIGLGSLVIWWKTNKSA